MPARSTRNTPAPPPGSVESWAGGFVRTDAKGRRVYVIRRMIDSKRYVVSTRCTTERAAFAELERFERDPAAYRPGGASRPTVDPIYLTDELGQAFLVWSRDVEHNSATWLRNKRRYVLWWAEQLRGRDLRNLDLAVVTAALDREPAARAHKIAVLKHLFRYLVKARHALKDAEDPTFTGLAVPQARPEQWRREKAARKTDVDKLIKILGEPWRSAMIVLKRTGWHVSELERFAVHGRVEDGVLVNPETKGGEVLRTPVPADAVKAARVVQRFAAEGRPLRGDTLNRAIEDACKAHNKTHGAKVAPIKPGSLRHSVATWAMNAGEDPATVAAFLGHKSPRTTRKFYATHATPRRPRGI